MYLIPHLAGCEGPVVIYELVPGVGLIPHSHPSYEEMLVWLGGEHVAARLLGQPLLDLTLAPTEAPQT